MLGAWPPILGDTGPVTAGGWAHLRPRPTQTLSLAGDRWHILIQEPLWVGPGKEAEEPVRRRQLQRQPGLGVVPGLPSSLATPLPGTLDSSASIR